jgi:predicted HicB family RNase H-like nuclease
VVLAGRGDRRTRRREVRWQRPKKPWTQLSTRIPKELHRRLRLYCVKHDIVLMRFVAAAIEEKLGRTRGSKKKTA